MKILVAVDLAVRTHDVLLARTDRFARRVQATVDLVYVRKKEATLAEIDHFETRLRGLLDQIEPARQGTTRIEAADEVDAAIADASSSYDLVVVGPREPGALERLLRGVMSVRVLKRARSPVLIPRGEGAWADPPRMLVGVDLGGGVDQELVKGAAGWAVRLGAKVDLVYAVAERLPTIREASVAEKAEREWLARHSDLVEQLEAHLAKLPEACRGAPVLRRGDPETVLLSLSHEYDFVVVGNRARTGLVGILLGAVAGPVARQAGCDVLTLNTAE